MRIFLFTNAARNRSLRIVQYVTAIVLASSIVLAGSNVANSRQSKPEATSPQQVRERFHPAPSTQTVYAPGGLKKFSQAEILLNNRSPDKRDVTAAFYTPEGAAVTGRTVTLKPAEVRSMELADLMLSDHPVKKKVTGMTLTYFGGMMEVAAQITLPGAHGAGSVDIPFSGAMDYHSYVQEAVWWMPEGAESTIILGNAGEAPIVASLKYGNGESQDVSLGPFATEIVERRSDQTNVARGAAESVRLELSGPIGSLRATGFVTSVDNRFSSGIRFYDPKAIRQPNLFATNLRLRKSKPRMVLKNIGDEVISATPRFMPLAGELGNGFELSTLSIAPHQATEVDLEPLRKAATARSDFDMVSVQVVNGSGANNLIGALYGTDSKSATTYDVPLRDSGPVGHSTGGYPWRLDGDYSSVISISNTRDSASKYRVTINYEGGRYTLDVKELAGGETAVFDLRSIRDERVPDKDGNTIPRSVSTGQFRWSLIGGDTSRLIGRSEVVSKSNRVSSSFSCPVCCPDSFAGFAFGPSSSAGPVGGTAVLAVDGFYSDCYFNLSGPFGVSPYGLWVQTPSVLSIAMISNGSAQMGCLSLGQSQFGGWVDGTWYENDGMDCYSRFSSFGGEGNGEVVEVSIGDFAGVGKDQTANVQVTLTPSPIQSSVTLKLSTTSGSGVAKFNSNGTTTLNINQSGEVTIKGKTESSTVDNMKLEAKAGSQSLGLPRLFTVIKVTLSLRAGQGQATSADNAGRTNYITCVGQNSLGTFLQSGACMPHVWGTAVEVIGTVLPSNYAGVIVLHRLQLENRTYLGNNLTQSNSNTPDDSNDIYRDDSPQSGGSNGKVYDLDAPRLGSTSSDPTGTVWRARSNFRQWATLGASGAKVSSDFGWFSRLSVIRIGSSDQLRTDVTGDNVAGSGTTKLTWNLQ